MASCLVDKNPVWPGRSLPIPKSHLPNLSPFSVLTTLAFSLFPQHHTHFSVIHSVWFSFLPRLTPSLSSLNLNVTFTGIFFHFARLVKSSDWTLPLNLSFCTEIKNCIIELFWPFPSQLLKSVLLFSLYSPTFKENFGILWVKVGVGKNPGGGKWRPSRAKGLRWPQAKGSEVCLSKEWGKWQRRQNLCKCCRG